MKPPRFAYARASTLDEALRMLAERPGEIRLLAGGQSLVPMLNLRIAAPAALLDINHIPDLSNIEAGPNGVKIGALTRHRAIESSETLRAALPILPHAAAEIGHPAIRNRGTIGGSLAHADPAAEWPTIAVALDAQLTATSVRGDRTIAAREFFAGPFATALEPDEILTAISFEPTQPETRFGFAEFCRRRGDFAIAAVVCALSFNRRGVCETATLCVAGAHSVPLLVADAAPALRGSRGEHESIAAAAAAAAAAVDPSSDIHASADFRRRIVSVLTMRALRECFARQIDKVTAHA